MPRCRAIEAGECVGGVQGPDWRICVSALYLLTSRFLTVVFPGRNL